MSRILVLALNTFNEAIRQKVMLIILVFSLVVIASATFFTYLAPKEEAKFIVDFGMGSILLFGLLMCIFLGATLIPMELERKTIFTVLSKPVRRVEFILGKFLGTLMTVFANVLLMGVVFLIVYYWKAHTIQANVLWALLMIFFMLAILASISVMVSIVGSMAFNVVFTFLIYFLGASSESLKAIATQPEQAANPLLQALLRTIYYIVPHFDNFDVRLAIVQDRFIPPRDMVMAILYALAYTTAVVVLAWFFFRDKEF